MKSFRPFCQTAAAGVLLVALASPSLSFAHEYEQPRGHLREMDPQKRLQWVKGRLDKEAAMLEIKPSQQSAWDGYAAAAVDLVAAFGDRKPLPPTAEAATLVRQRADRAAAMAQHLAKLADATEKLQSVLDDEQRKVLGRIVREHIQFRGRHPGEAVEGHRPRDSKG